MDSLEDKLLIRCNTSPAPAQTDTLRKCASDPLTFFETQDFSDERALGTALWPYQQHHLHTHSPVLQVVGKGLYFSPVIQTYTQKVTSSCLVGPQTSWFGVLVRRGTWDTGLCRGKSWEDTRRREDGHLQAKVWDFRWNQPCGHLNLRLLASWSVRKLISFV